MRARGLRHVHCHATTNIREPVKALERDYSKVHADDQALISVGLLDVSKTGLRDEYDSIETKIAM
jgi:predicted transcriptional regulator